MFRVILEASQGMRERENLLVLPLNYKQKEASFFLQKEATAWKVTDHWEDVNIYRRDSIFSEIWYKKKFKKKKKRKATTLESCNFDYSR